MKKDKQTYFIIDFDSTFIQTEALDELFRVSLQKNPQRGKIFSKIENLTKLGMEGKISFSESLKKRIEYLDATKGDLEKLVKRLKGKISPSVFRNKDFFRKFGSNIFIISGGFKEIIIPIVEKFHIPPENVFANSFTFDGSGYITGYDKSNLLAKNNGKLAQIKKLGLKGDLYVIGDGYTDYELKKEGIAHKFFAFTENIERDIVTSKADHIAPSFDEFLYVNKLPMAISYPKNRIKVLLLENVHPDALALFKKEGYQVETVKDSLDENILSQRIKDITILGIRSKTTITRKVLDNANRLLTIGAFCIGTNQIDIIECAGKGIAVFNAPFSNTRSVVEMAIAEIIVLMRQVFDKSINLHRGIWDKSSSGSFEIRGKKLGIIGYGKIGSQLSILAESLGMEVYYYDIVEKLGLGNAKRMESLKDLLKKSDVISVHVDGNPANFNIISEKEFRLMKEGVIFLNLSRGFVVDLKALEKFVRTGKVKGAAVDVFPDEPFNNTGDFKSELQSLPNVILTPHIGGSTMEAQKNIAGFVPAKIIDFINSGNTYFSVNFPNLQLPALQNAHRLIHIHRNMPGVLASINNVLAEKNINITGQYLKTNEMIGYVITDISKKYDPEVIGELKKIPHTIKFRILY